MSEIKLRTSERNLFKRCQWAWERNYIDRLENGNRFSTALWFGTGIHLALEKWYIPGVERGVHPVETWKAYCEEARGNTKFINTYLDGDFSEAVSATELGIAMLNNYVKEYGTEPHIEVISAEQTFNVGIRYSEWTGHDGTVVPEDTVGRYVGTFDLVWRDLRDGKIYLTDHKTAAQLGASNTQYLPLDDQAGAYMALANHTLREQGLIEKNERISGIVYNYLVKRKPDLRPRNADGYCTNKPLKKHYVAQLEGDRLDKMKLADLELLAQEQGVTVLGEISAVQPAPLLERKVVYRSAQQNRAQIRRVSEDMSHMSIVRNNLLPAAKTPTRECGFCQFRDICELDEQGKDWQEYSDLVYRHWDPYGAHTHNTPNNDNKENQA